MAKLVRATLEAVEHGDADAVTLYFEGTPTDAETAAAFRGQYGKLDLYVDPDNPCYQTEIVPTPASEQAGLVRIQGFPAS